MTDKPGQPPQGINRRRFHRSERVTATALVFANGRYAGAFVVENLSGGGALFIGEARIDVGAQVTILLQLQRKPIPLLDAHVVRHDVGKAGHHHVAVAFRNVQPQTQELLQKAVVAGV